MLKKILVGAIAAKTYNATKRPTVSAPTGFTVVGIQHRGIGKKWEITYIDHQSRNLKRKFTIDPSVKSMNFGGNSFDIYWP